MYIEWKLAEIKNEVAMFNLVEFFPGVISSDRYDIVEKPDYRKRRLEQEILDIEARQNSYQQFSDHYLTQIKKLSTKLEELKKELAGLK